MVIGTCLKIADVTQAAVKASIPVKNKSDYDLHQLAVESAANKKHPLTQNLQKILERQYASDVRRYRLAKDPESLSELWAADWSTGHVAGALWALITSPIVTREIIMRAFGEVHMMSHLSGSSACVDRQRLASQERQIDTLTQELGDVKRRLDKARQSSIDDKQMFKTEQVRSRALSAQLQCKTNDQAKPESTTSAKPGVPEGLVNRLRGTVTDLRQMLGDQQATNEKHGLEIARLRRQLNSRLKNDSSRSAQELKLCGQCVLYLGGKAQQRRHFQELVESCEGRFLHHDGGVEACPHRIAELVTQADIVMCPTDCISHGAMEKARSLCAKKDIPIVFMRRASLSNFTRSLHQAMG